MFFVCATWLSLLLGSVNGWNASTVHAVPFERLFAWITSILASLRKKANKKAIGVVVACDSREVARY